MAKILIINLPAYGHVNPTLALARELSNRNHQVSYLITEEFREEIEATGATVISYSERIKNLPSVESLATHVPIIYEMALDIGASYDCIFYEMVFYLGKQLGEVLNKPTVHLISTFAFNKKIMDNVLKGHAVKPEISHQRNALFQHYQKSLTDVPGLNLVYTSREFQVYGEDFDPKTYKFVGPSISKRIIKTDIPFDSLKETVIYISLGTISSISNDFFKTCVKAFSGMDASVIIAVGKKVDINSLCSIPSNFLVYQSVPQLEVLKYTDVFITHGGMNSVHESIYYGVPVVAIPQRADQPFVAKRLADLSLGKVIQNDELSVENLKSSVNEVLTNPVYKLNMDKMRELMINAGGYKSSVDEIEKYIAAHLEKAAI